MELRKLITKAEKLIEEGFSQEDVEKRLIPLIKNENEKKILSNKIFDFCFQFNTAKEVRNQIKLKVAAGIFAALIGIIVALILGRLAIILTLGGIYYAYSQNKKLKLPVKNLNKKSFVPKRQERRF